METAPETREIPQYSLKPARQILLYLLTKELQGRQFTLQLSSVGFDTSLFNTGLGLPILSHGAN